MGVYYNEIDPFAAKWLRELIKAGVIATGEVDERSIEDVIPSELSGYTQCHFFAGIGVWSYALRQAGWADDRNVWTGSCPCQSFSTAGKGKGFADERHLFPAFFHLIEQCRPDVIFGEQVAVAVKYGWLDLVQDDLEGIGYTFGAHGLAACNLGAPHIRKRLYFVADTNSEHGTLRRNTRIMEREVPDEKEWSEAELRLTDTLANVRMANNNSRGFVDTLNGEECKQGVGAGKSEGSRRTDLGNIASIGQHRGSTNGGSVQPEVFRAGYTSGFWGNAEWLLCKDGFARPTGRETQSSIESLVDGLADDLGYCSNGDTSYISPLVQETPNRVGRLRGYGNAICAPVAQAFIEAYQCSRNRRRG